MLRGNTFEPLYFRIKALLQYMQWRLLANIITTKKNVICLYNPIYMIFHNDDFLALQIASQLFYSILVNGYEGMFSDV